MVHGREKTRDKQTHGEDAVEVGGLHEEIVLVALAALEKLLGVFLIQNRARVVHLTYMYTCVWMNTKESRERGKGEQGIVEIHGARKHDGKLS